MEVSPLEMATAYCPLANGGNRVEPVFLLRLQTRNGRVLEETAQGQQVLDERTAYIMTSMLKGVVQPGGTASRVAGILTRPAAGKTGSTNEYRDAWFMGYLRISSSASTPDTTTRPQRSEGWRRDRWPHLCQCRPGRHGRRAACDFPRPAGIVDVI